MNRIDQLKSYKETKIKTANQGKLIVMLYDGAIKFMRLAIRELEAGNYEEKGRYINKALDIINELNVILDTEAGGEIASNLRQLYVFTTKQLSQANVKRDPQMIR
ncbi:hypothetical protein LCGC14_2870250, partial [marine sediment metagenome]